MTICWPQKRNKNPGNSLLFFLGGGRGVPRLSQFRGTRAPPSPQRRLVGFTSPISNSLSRSVDNVSSRCPDTAGGSNWPGVSAPRHRGAPPRITASSTTHNDNILQPHGLTVATLFRRKVANNVWQNIPNRCRPMFQGGIKLPVSTYLVVYGAHVSGRLKRPKGRCAASVTRWQQSTDRSCCCAAKTSDIVEDCPSDKVSWWSPGSTSCSLNRSLARR